ncbi:DNA-protecting protein DprA [Rhodobacteraceae bacterium RKSG542]|uniref:DNA-processing protein DprA n=1 Tax=Pseudovibrio flavus TaxID=2529854 RepID=UPI0012BC106E|nr:DNA-processing protein DprA [Pseudovibrio flavus]MTI16374.1 DNA-protecting protein DprA [Pseudovibrio flavus]
MLTATKPNRHLSNAQRLSWLRLIRSENVGPSTFRELLNHFGSAQAALDALPDISARGGKKTYRPCTEDKALREMEALSALGGRLVAMGEPDYPARLHHIDAPPPLLSVRGKPVTNISKSLAIVGARNASLSGKKMAYVLAAELSQAGYVIVSGLARGIDSAAHAASLKNGTVGVFAGGVDHIYPDENIPLCHSMLEANGAVLSEMPLGWKPRARDFPRRNRLISGISLGTIIIEAAKKSGSLHTARFALEQGREVFAVPGSPLDPRSEGANRLIQQGAYLVNDSQDVLSALDTLNQPFLPFSEDGDQSIDIPENHWKPASTEARPDQRRAITQALSATPTDIDELARHAAMPVSAVRIVLLELELAGKLERHTRNRVSLVL